MLVHVGQEEQLVKSVVLWLERPFGSVVVLVGREPACLFMRLEACS